MSNIIRLKLVINRLEMDIGTAKIPRFYGFAYNIFKFLQDYLS